MLLLSPNDKRDPERQISVLLLFISSIRNAHTDPPRMQWQKGPGRGEECGQHRGRCKGSTNLPCPNFLPSPCCQSKGMQGRRGNWQWSWVLASAFQEHSDQHLPEKPVGNHFTNVSVPPLTSRWDVIPAHRLFPNTSSPWTVHPSSTNPAPTWLKKSLILFHLCEVCRPHPTYPLGKHGGGGGSSYILQSHHLKTGSHVKPQQLRHIRHDAICAGRKLRKQSALWLGASQHTRGSRRSSVGSVEVCVFPVGRHRQGGIPLPEPSHQTVPWVLSREKSLNEESKWASVGRCTTGGTVLSLHS